MMRTFRFCNCGKQLLITLLLLITATFSFSQNPIVTENALTGNPSSEWDIAGAGDLSIQGFATDISVNKGQTVHFKISTDASAYKISIYRLGYYNGNGARKIDSGTVTATLPQVQPEPLVDTSTGLVDCGNWSESASWNVPSTAVSGIYIAKLTRTDNGGSSHIVFIVRDDASHANLFFQASDATWQAYNNYGGNSLYVGSTNYPAGHAAKVSYNRPFVTRNGGGGGGASEDWLFNSEYPMIRFLEKNGFDISYTTNIDVARFGSLLLNHKVYLSVGHDEYWSAEQRANVEAARDAGVHLAFFSGNEVYWKTRWENSTEGSNTPYRTLVCYKEGTLGENVCGGKCDPTNIWTGLWRDGCDNPGTGACKPENALSGEISWQGSTSAIQVPAAYKDLRFWRNTSIASLNPGDIATLPDGTLGYEWSWEQYPDSYPSGRITLSSTTIGGKTHKLSLYRASSGALVFGAGTVQWAWGLDEIHDRGNLAANHDMQQATINVLADMGVQPATLQAGLVAATQSTDTQAPVTIITSPVNNASLIADSAVVITGTSSDAGGILVGVEISFDGGTTWHAVNGTTNWTYNWTPTTSEAGPVSIKVRGFDDSGNMEVPGTPGSSNNITVNVSSNLPSTFSIFQPGDTPAVPLQNDGLAIEVGTKFSTAVNGYVAGLRYYKGEGVTGTHIGHLWTGDGVKLGEATFADDGEPGWQEVILANPIAITANTTYIVSYHSASGDYAYTTPYFTQAVVNGPLRGLADGEDGPNGVYAYSSASAAFPTSSFNASNYWTDVIFVTTVGPDVTPPTIISISPQISAVAVNVNSTVTANFSESLDGNTVNNSTFELRDASNVLVPATVSYNPATNTIILTPASPLLFSYTYTATVKGGASGVKDLAGNPLQNDLTWSFTTTSSVAISPTEGHGGPVLVISNTLNPFSRYAVEILRAEGFNEFAALDITAVNASVLNNYDVVVLGEMSVSPSQATMLSDWTNAGGTLIAFKPASSLSSLFGLTSAGSTLDNKYLLVNTASGPGAGIVNQTLQYHGAADLYTITGGSGTTSIATLYSDATTATTNPAITTRNIGANGGKAIAFTFDLARSIVYTRQGNPAWAGQKRDGTNGPIRSDDMFFGLPAASGNDWVDFSKIAIPQADEQQRLLANIIIQSNLHRKPLPRFWYLPRSLKAAIVMTGDDHSNNGTEGRFNLYNHLSDSIGHNTPQDVANWYAIRGTSYMYSNTPITNSQAALFQGQGFELAAHPFTEPVCSDFTPESLEENFTDQLSEFSSTFPSLAAPATSRTHCLVWSDWSSLPKTEVNHGIRMDVTYYYWPDTWVQNRPGMFTGSGMPMRYADIDGTLIDCYQAPTQMTDESGIDVGAFCDAVLDKAIGPEGYYGVFTANMHTDTAIHIGSNAIIASALARQIPVISTKQLLTWTDGRNNSFFGAMTWTNNQLTFPITASEGAVNLRTMLPHFSGADPLTSLTRNGSPVSFTIETIKGIEYAIFDVPVGTGIYVANYSAAPAVTKQPAPLTICEASIVTFKSNATGIPFPATQWQVSSDGTNWSNINGATDSTLSFTAAMSDNNKQYRAVWSNLAGTINSTAASLTVKAKPSAPGINVSNNCGSSLLTATGITGSLSWSTTETTPSITVTTAGSYAVSQTVNGCISDNGNATATPKIVPTAPSVAVSDNCGNSLLTASNFAGTLLWSTGETTSSINVGTPGTYMVTQTVNGCVSANGGAAAAPKAIPSAPSVSVVNNCGNSVLTASAFTGSLLWSTGETTSSITVTTAATYTATQSINGCTSVNGNGVAAPKLIPSAPAVSVANNCGNSVLTASAFTGSLLWSTGETTAAITVTAGGSYTVAQTINGCTSDNGSVTAAPKVIPSAPSVTVGNNCGSSLLTAGNINGSLLWSTGETTPSITVTTAATYTVMQTLNGCVSTNGSGTAAPKTVPSSPSVAVVNNCGNSVLTASAFTGSLLWNSGQTTSSITVNNTATYTVSQIINGCASAPASVDAAPKAIPTAPAVSVLNGCGVSVLTASNFTGALNWSNAFATPSITVSNAGTYAVTQTINGCTSPIGTGIAAPVAIPPVPRITAVNNCGSSLLTASLYTGTLLWSTGETTPAITVAHAGSYRLTQTVNGCTSPAVDTRGGIAAPKTIPAAPTVSSIDNCGSSVLTASNYTGSLLWSTGQTTSPISVTNGGTYTATQTVNGCTSAVSPVEATPKVIPATPTISTDGPTSFCQGGSVTLTSSQSTGNLWSTGATTQSIVVSTSGTYTLSYTTADGCTAPDLASIGVTVKLPSSSTTNITICSSQLPYSWNGHSYATAGSYSVPEFINAVGCDSTANLVLTVIETPVPPVISALGSTTFCQGGSVVLISNKLTPGNTWSTGSLDQSILVHDAGVYTVTYTAANGCTSANSDPVTVTVNIPSISTTNLTICANELPYTWNSHSFTTAGTYNVTLNNNVGCDSVAVLILHVKDTSVSTTNVTICSNELPYSWNGHSYAAAGTYPVGGFTNAVGCDSTAVLVLTVKATTNSIANVTLCSNELPYHWNGTDYTIAGTYTVGGFTNAAGCDSTATLNLTINATTSSTTNVTICSDALPYSWNGTDYTTAGSYTIHLTNAAGCDSATTLVLTVNTTPLPPTITVDGATTFCPGGSVTLTSSQATGNLWSTGETTQSIVVTTAGSYTVTYTSPTGCVSSASSPIVVTVNATTSSTTDVTICSDALPYHWNGIEYSDAGAHVVHLTNAAGCDSIATLNLTINATTSSTTDVTICSDAIPYSWNGNDYSTSGAHVVHLTNAAGCDSIATLNLTINAVTTSTTDVTICSDAIPYSWNGNDYSTPGAHVVHLTNAAGCDSIATLNLTINAVTTSTTDVTICSDALPYHWNGNDYSTPGAHVVHLTNVAGCDSIATLNLTINATTTSTTDVTICSDAIPYSWNGNDYSTPGAHVVHLTNAAGCDSIATLNLTINAVTTSTTDVTICSDALPYHWNGNDYSTPGAHVVHLTNAAGCDSIATLNLTINATTTSTTDVTICSDALPYHWNGNEYNAAGAHVVHLTNAAGCDSIATLNLTINATTTSTTDVTICSDALPYHWNGNDYSTPGAHVVHLTNAAGCDSIATLNLTINATTTSTTDVTVCSDAIPYSWNGNNYSTPGAHVVHLTNAAGCDSIATLNLTINAITTSTTDVTICSDALPYHWNGNEYNTAGAHVVHLTNAAGCDSIATLNLAINATTTSTTDVTICSDAIPYSWNGNNYSTPGAHVVHLTNAAGCDSIATLNLTINATTSSTTDVTICSDALPYHWNGNDYSTPGAHVVHLTNAAGCDSIATLNLTINATTSSTTDVTICSDAIPYSWNGNDYSTPGAHVVHLINAAGCDSIATLNLTINATTSSTTDVTICSDALPYHWNGNDYSTPGAHVVHLTNAAGCDSIATLNLTINATTSSTTDVTICSDALPYHWNGNEYSDAGAHVVHLINAAGCDSIATLNLTINATSGSTTNVTVCSDALPYHWNGNDYIIAGSYDFHLTNSVGCDSTATLVLTINTTPPAPTISASGAITFCEGGSVTLTSSQVTGNLWSTGETTQSIVVNTAGSYTVTYTSPTGCVSDVSAPTAVTVNTPTSSTTNVTVCSNTLPYNWNGTDYTTAGAHVIHLTNAAGCDSTATLNLTINAGTSSTTDITICSSGLPYHWNGTDYPAAGSYTIHLSNSAGCDSAATLHLIVNQATTSTTTITNCDSLRWNGVTYTVSGTYTANFPGGNSAGCDSTATLILTIHYSTSSETNVTVCSNTLPYIWNGLELAEASRYHAILVNAAGCDSIAYINLTVNDSPAPPTITPSGSTTFPEGGNVTLTSNHTSNNLWSTTATDQSIVVTASGSYTVTYTADNGCTATSSPTVVTVTGGGRVAAPATTTPQQPLETGPKIELTAMPNPTTSYFNLAIKSNSQSPVTVRILDNFGGVREYYEKVAPNTVLRVGDGLKGGIYLAEIIQDGKRKVIKIIKAN